MDEPKTSFGAPMLFSSRLLPVVTHLLRYSYLLQYLSMAMTLTTSHWTLENCRHSALGYELAVRPSFEARRRRMETSMKLAESSSSSSSSSDAQRDGGFPSFSLPANEFSRTVPPDRIRATTSPNIATRRGRDYQLSISASDTECQALARRFDLAGVESLDADLVLRSEPSGGNHGGVEVDGHIVASLTQTCVRTNQDFQVQLEFPFYAIVRPVIPLISLRKLDNDEVGSNNRDSIQQQQQRRGKSVSYRTSSSLDEVDLLEMQRMLQEDIALEQDDASLMEDEAIYPKGGAIDVGELVSQLFWLNLDPYPKMPGTDPINTKISG